MKTVNLLTNILFFLFPFSLSFGQSITIAIETENVAAVLKTDKDNRLKIIYFGKSLSNTNEYELTGEAFNFQSDGASSNNSAYAVAGIDNNYIEPAISVVHVDGNNSLDLLYESHTTARTNEGAILTTVTLKDPVYPFFVDLYYKAWKDKDVIE